MCDGAVTHGKVRTGYKAVDAWGGSAVKGKEIHDESLLTRVLPGGDANGADAVDWERRATEWAYQAIVDFFGQWSVHCVGFGKGGLEIIASE